MTDTGPALFVAGVVFALSGEVTVGLPAMALGALWTARERAAALDNDTSVEEQQQQKGPQDG